MKKATPFLLILIAVLLAACGAAKRTANPSTGAGNDPAARTLAPLAQVAIGTFKLEGTDKAVTAKQAAELLPLWQVYESLSQSNTAAQAEIDALVGQIQDSMTKEQNAAIQAMNLTPQDMFAVMREHGIELAGGPQAAGTRVPGSGQNNREGFPPGGFVGGPGPDGGGFQGGPGQFNRTGGTPPAGSGQNGAAQPRQINRIPTPLLNALIELLKQRAAS